MNTKFELFSGTYRNYADELYQDIRKETYGEDIGQTSWLTANEYRDPFLLLQLSPGKNVLEIASGSGGPAVFMVKATGCQLTGADINVNGLINANRLVQENSLGDQVKLMLADCSKPIPLPGASFDAVICIDSMNHLKNRANVLKEFNRLLKPGGHVVYTDPVVVTGIISSEEIAARSSVGFFLFMPPGENEKLLKLAGFKNIRSKDLTGSMAETSINWYNARQTRKDDLLLLEEPDNFLGLQSFFKMVHTVSAERRLSRIRFIAEK